MNVACKIGDTCKLEICCFDLESIQLASNLGVPSVEFCIDYPNGGLWPGIEMLREARKIFQGRLSVMIRPRPGDFHYNLKELDFMQGQIRIARDCGVDGLTLGCVGINGEFHERVLQSLIGDLAGQYVLTFHRAFDLLREPQLAIPKLVGMGFSRILTSGGGKRAVDHKAFIALLQTLAGPGLDIIAAGGVRPNDLAILCLAGIRAVHSAASDQSNGRANALIMQGMMKWCLITSSSKIS